MEPISWQLDKRKVSDLVDHPDNPRKLTRDQAKHLQESISRYGLIDKPIINTDNVIIGGHQRKNILRKLKIKEVQCWVPSRTLEPKEVQELNIRLNKNTGDWDYDILANNWDEVDLIDWGFDPQELGFDTTEEELEEKEKGKKTCPNCGHEL